MPTWFVVKITDFRSGLALVALAALLGCAGTRFAFSEARKITVGMTESELVTRMGKPYMVRAGADGTQVWIWSQANGFTGAAQSVSFILRDGKVASLPKIPDSF